MIRNRLYVIVLFLLILGLSPSHHQVLAKQSDPLSWTKQTYESMEKESSSLQDTCRSMYWLTAPMSIFGINPCVALGQYDTSPITITFGGDVLMEYSLVQSMKENGADHPFQYVKPYFQKSDYTVINLETPITHATSAFPKKYNFKASPLLLDGLKTSGVDMVSLANNHTLDYGEKGLLDTLDALEEASMEKIGAGRNAEDAYAERIVNIKGNKIAFLAFSEVLPSVSWYAGENKPGIASGYQVDRASTIVEKVKEKADYVLVYYHWGDEKVNKPNQDQKHIAKSLIDHGADAIIGSHPHVLQGFETYKGKPIAYSLGNFLFPDYVSGPTADTGVLELTLENEKVTMSFHPHTLVNNQITPLSNVDRSKQYRYLESISNDVFFDEKGQFHTVIPASKNGQ
ncbi:CapA family protein [Pontibacillus marinus]|uniref:Capsule synthesis protein CapA domain-containing protein n=1 Tax=Pontibacillus marinus BH030004 = DSM 16465 TaxID=1385511 RepID=A0A0A5G4X8_9BACI|nr:CapA family protein [Pontibacillus marinus]KGX86135.1 hypothetical protein N783_12505 [Pontibacillus marinus BH030004 = DSM 16465]